MYVYRPSYYPARRASYGYYDPTPVYYGNGRYYDDDYYYYDDDYYDDGFDWQGLLLQTALSMFLGGDSGLGAISGIISPATDYYYPQQAYYDPYAVSNGYYNDPYESYAYRPAAYYGSQMPYDSQVLNNVYSQGYNEGYVAGQHARDREYGMAYYNDPYVYENGGYYPYSTSIGQNRYCMSEGYRRGYYDALNETGQMYGGQTDLVSLMLGNVLSLS